MRFLLSFLSTIPPIIFGATYLASVDSLRNMADVIDELGDIEGVTVKKVFEIFPTFVFQASNFQARNAVSQLEHVVDVEHNSSFYGGFSNNWIDMRYKRNRGRPTSRRPRRPSTEENEDEGEDDGDFTNNVE
eukprot:TRINITY_DN72644_c0_g1_i1.p1 TRINITY_DN72644_c0_g1~~TRINITY_DN72644_c0_g1_i1.p1  ORF type:complete len:132 (+),score=16.51 TRINITY_DN72644_c0_g1_i1:173-568(+)